MEPRRSEADLRDDRPRRDAPAVGYPAAPGQLVLSGLGIPKGATVAEQNLEHLEIRYGMSHGTLGAVEEKPVG